MPRIPKRNLRRFRNGIREAPHRCPQANQKRSGRVNNIVPVVASVLFKVRFWDEHHSTNPALWRADLGLRFVLGLPLAACCIARAAIRFRAAHFAAHRAKLGVRAIKARYVCNLAAFHARIDRPPAIGVSVRGAGIATVKRVAVFKWRRGVRMATVAALAFRNVLILLKFVAGWLRAFHTGAVGTRSLRPLGYVGAFCEAAVAVGHAIAPANWIVLLGADAFLGALAVRPILYIGTSGCAAVAVGGAVVAAYRRV